jgi:hypothetical protein
MIGKAINPDISVSVHRSLRNVKHASVEGSVWLWSGVMQVAGIFQVRSNKPCQRMGRRVLKCYYYPGADP